MIAVLFGGYRIPPNIRTQSGGDAIIIRKVADKQALTVRRPTKVTKVVIRPGADRAKVLEWLRENL